MIDYNNLCEVSDLRRSAVSTGIIELVLLCLPNDAEVLESPQRDLWLGALLSRICCPVADSVAY
jgi:hypothetical protein